MSEEEEQEQKQEKEKKEENMGSGLNAKFLYESSLKFFLYQADQRMKAFNFYVIIAAAVIGGYCAILSKQGQYKPTCLKSRLARHYWEPRSRLHL
jgi:hypothetical protein